MSARASKFAPAQGAGGEFEARSCRNRIQPNDKNNPTFDVMTTPITIHQRRSA
jgi:hypothetical protein